MRWRLSRIFECFSVTRIVAIIVLVLTVLVGAQQAIAQTPSNDSSASVVHPDAPVDPYEAVREGNRLLNEGEYADALQLYEQARQEKPDAREIAFAEGLSEYHLGDYERARDLFRQAAAGKNDALTDDATYSIGTTYHSDALLSQDNPKAALSQLEQAMEHYQNVLNHDPNHAAARDAYRKAGMTWRTIKQQKQQQSNNQDKNNDKENEDQDQNQEQSDQQQDQSQKQNEQQEQQSSEDQQESQEQQRQSDQDKQENQQEQSSEAQDEKQDESSAQEKDEGQKEDEQQKQASAEEEERVSKEQAERKLREMMQAVRERKERRRQPTKLIPARPVDKDW